MADSPAFSPKKTLEELKSEALARLERRGYEIRGKTPAEIDDYLSGGPESQNQMPPNPPRYFKCSATLRCSISDAQAFFT